MRDEHGHLLLAAGQVIHGDTQLQTLLSRGIHADVEEIKALAAGRKVEPQAPTLFARWMRSFWSLDALSRLPADPDHFLPACTELGDGVAALVRQEPDVAIYQMLRQEAHHLRMYGLTHAVLSAALCLLVSARLQWSEAAQRSLLMAALTMNITVLELQARYAVYGRLTADLREELERHPDDAVTRLRSAGVTDEDWLRSVAEHHEHVDGKGYPRRLREVSEAAQLLRLVDVFLAKISRREGRPAIDVREAERHAYHEWPGQPAGCPHWSRSSASTRPASWSAWPTANARWWRGAAAPCRRRWWWRSPTSAASPPTSRSAATARSASSRSPPSRPTRCWCRGCPWNACTACCTKFRRMNPFFGIAD